MSAGPGTDGRADGAVALVTGGSRGLGAAVAAELVGKGYRVAVTGRDEVALRAVVDALGPFATALPGDVGDPDAVRGQFSELERLLGPPSVVVNNAGAAIPEAMSELTDGAVLGQVRTNLLGAMWTCREALRSMSDGGGHIVNVSSESVRDPLPMLGVYAATKAGLETFTLALAEEGAARGVRVSLFRPGRTVGGFSDGWSDAAKAAARSEWERSGRLARMDPGRMTAADAAAALVSLVTGPVTGFVSVMSTRPTGR